MKKLIVALALASAFCLALTGCSGGNNADIEKGKANFTGEWELVDITGDDSIASGDIDTLKSMGISVELSLKDDGTATLVFFGDEFAGTWKVKSATEADLELKADGETVADVITFEDGKVSMKAEGAALVFSKTK
ncbi:hypothetical protein JI75_04730 [Berryella intestinalis]|uniref:Lipocalin-like domain-containing protein n=1 Tax=Berryella intestinalis TaxID=1531429 RepID=A0A0A8BAE1_9ACTN|nr:glycoside hydrolase family 43 C-terminal domain-containing protein [Berryella intestinalis]AJC12077.1 hypothetical protein JI75_04730 [Berryella intestinalis]